MTVQGPWAKHGLTLAITIAELEQYKNSKTFCLAERKILATLVKGHLMIIPMKLFQNPATGSGEEVV